MQISFILDSAGSYYRARYYEPAVGRFISEDPVGFASGDPNFYSYVGDAPTGYFDPFGLCKIEIYYVRLWKKTLGIGVHAFLLVTDNTSPAPRFPVYELRGGPTDSNPPKLLPDFGPYNESSRDKISEASSHKTLVDNQCSCRSYNEKFFKLSQQIESENLDYLTFSQNSNAVVGSELRALGIDAGAPPWWTAGFDVNVIH